MPDSNGRNRGFGSNFSFDEDFDRDSNGRGGSDANRGWDWMSLLPDDGGTQQPRPRESARPQPASQGQQGQERPRQPMRPQHRQPSQTTSQQPTPPQRPMQPSRPPMSQRPPMPTDAASGRPASPAEGRQPAPARPPVSENRAQRPAVPAQAPGTPAASQRPAGTSVDGTIPENEPVDRLPAMQPGPSSEPDSKTGTEGPSWEDLDRERAYEDSVMRARAQGIDGGDDDDDYDENDGYYDEDEDLDDDRDEDDGNWDDEPEQEDEYEDVGKEAADAYIEKNKEFYEAFDYDEEMTPRIPERYRGVDILGLRTRGNGTVGVKMGSLGNKRKLQEIWNSLTPVQRYILMLVSEHRHLTKDQLYTFVIMPGSIRRANETEPKKARMKERLRQQTGKVPSLAEVQAAVREEDARRKAQGKPARIPVRDVLRTYTEWLFQTKYKVPLSPKTYKQVTKTSSFVGLDRSLQDLVDRDLLVARDPSYKVRSKGRTSAYTDTPSLFTEHYYLRPLGARVLVCNTAIKSPGTRSASPSVGYVETHMEAAYSSIVHETECTECLLSIVRCAQYMSNMEVFSPEAGDADYGYVDVCRCYHEKDCEMKRIDWRGTNGRKGIDFKSDGEVTIWSSKLNEFVDLFLEYDAGSSKQGNIAHKIEAYLKFILAMQDKDPEFRRPVMLLVSQKPSAWITSMNNGRNTTYTKAISQRMRTKVFEGVYDRLNEIGCVLVTDCNAMRQHGAMGACWHRIDLHTGVAEPVAHDLLSAVADFVRMG